MGELRQVRPEDGSSIQQCGAGLELGRRPCFLGWQAMALFLRSCSRECHTRREDEWERLVLSVKAESLSVGPLGA